MGLQGSLPSANQPVRATGHPTILRSQIIPKPLVDETDVFTFNRYALSRQPAGITSVVTTVPRFKIHIALFLTSALLFAGCRDFALDAEGGDASNFEGDGVATLEVPFELTFGQRVVLDETDYTVEFSLVTEDSRCANEVECVQAGRAGILLTVTDAQFVRYQLVAYIPGLVATPYEHNDIIQFQGYRFRLLQVDPYPVEGTSRDMSAYSVLLVVEPVAGG